MIDLGKLKKAIEKEIAKLAAELKAGTLDRNKLKSGLKQIKGRVDQIPPHKLNDDDDDD